MIFKLLLAAFLMGHALIHAGFISPRPPPSAGAPPWPFSLTASWALGALGVNGEVIRLIGIALVAVTIGGLALAALSVVGFLPSSLWPSAAALGAIASLSLLALFFHPWLLLGVLIDVLLLWAVLVARWVPESGAI